MRKHYPDETFTLIFLTQSTIPEKHFTMFSENSSTSKKVLEKPMRFLLQEQLEMYNVLVIFEQAVRGYCTPNLKLACFVLYLKIINTFLTNNACIKKIVQETQKWYWSFSRPSGYKVMDQNSRIKVLINNARIAWPTYILMPFLGQFTIRCVCCFSNRCW